MFQTKPVKTNQTPLAQHYPFSTHISVGCAPINQGLPNTLILRRGKTKKNPDSGEIRSVLLHYTY